MRAIEAFQRKWKQTLILFLYVLVRSTWFQRKNKREIQGGFSWSWNQSFWAFLAGAEAGAAELELVFSQLHGTGPWAEIFFTKRAGRSWWPKFNQLRNTAPNPLLKSTYSKNRHMHTNTQGGRDCTKRALERRAWKWKKRKAGMHNHPNKIFFVLFFINC